MSATGLTDSRQEAGLLEREEELERLGSAIDAACSGRGRIQLIEGQAGFGKSTLLAAAAKIAGDRQMSHLSARVTEIERDLPFGAIRQLLEGHLRSLPATERDELLAGSAAPAAAALGLAASPSSPPPVPGPTIATIYALHWLLASLAERAPLLLTIDDAHLLDADSARLLEFIAPRVAQMSLLLLVAARPDDPQGGLRPIEAASEQASWPIVLGPLSVDACAVVAASVLDAPLSPELTQAVHRASGGNPFYLRALLDHLRRENRALEGTDASAEEILSLGPPAVTRAIVARIGRLSPPAGAVARAVAILDEDPDAGPALLSRLAEVDPAERLDALDALSGISILEDGDQIRFRHPIVRNAVYADIGRGERLRLHRRAAALLRAEGAAPERIAAHLLLTDPAAEAEIVETLRGAAAAAVARGAPVAASSYLRRALEEPPPAADRGAVLAELGHAELATEGAAAHEHLRQALESTPAGEARVAVVRSLAAAHLSVGRLGPLGDLLREEVERASASGAELDARELESDLAMTLLTGLDGAAMSAGHERVERLAPDLTGSTAAERALLSCLAYSRLCRGLPAPEVAEPAVRRLERLERTPGEGLAEIPTADWILNLGVLLRCGELELVERAALAGLETARTSGSLYAVGGAHWLLGVASRLRGRLSEASSRLEVALRAARDFGAVAGVHASLVSLVAVEVERGELRAAEAALAAEGFERGPIEAVVTPGELLESRALLRLAQGDAREALVDLERAGSVAAERGDLGPGMTAWRSGAALAHLRLGEREQARALVDEELERARTFGAVPTVGAALVAAARIEGGERALELLEEAVELLGGSCFRLLHAEALVEQGAARRRSGRRAAAREPLGAGLDLARSCGAATLAERAFEELRATGARPRKVLRTGIDALTPSEGRVARLAASGMSNREIAQELFVSPRTVEFHLRQVFVKLEISARGELPSALEPVDD